VALRQQVWIDRSVQGVLVGRVILYWGFAMLYVGMSSVCFHYNQNPDWTVAKHAEVLFGQMWPWLPSAVFLLPLAIYDVVRMSNLFAGPVFRIRKHFAAMQQDIACAPLVFREDDYWRDLAQPINDMQAEILRLRADVKELQKADSSESTHPTDAPTVAEFTAMPVNEHRVELQASFAEILAVKTTADEDSVIAIAPLPTPIGDDIMLEAPSVVPVEGFN